MILSILIATIKERRDKFTKLLAEIDRQNMYCENYHPTLGLVQVVVNSDNRFLDGGPSIGAKRQGLLDASKGDYICYLDDDEDISPNYVESLLRLCKQDQDVCTFRAMVKLKDFWALVDMRLTYRVNDQISPEYTIRRPPWQMCPVRSKYAKLYKFNDKNNAEDFEWMEKVLTHCTTEAHTDKILFTYNHGDHSEADKIPLP